MNTGVTFTKCGRKGAPHRRLFKTNRQLLGNSNIDDASLIDALVNLEDSYLFWYSGEKVKSKSYVWFKQIKRIILGQQTNNFKRHKKSLAPFDHLSFSIVYSALVKNTEKEMTLDLVSPTKEQFDVFVFGTKVLWRAIKTGRLEGMGFLQEHLSYSFRQGPLVD
jgi:hypothetical protein